MYSAEKLHLHILKQLNAILAVDTNAISRLAALRTDCGLDLASHDHVQVHEDSEGFTLGFIGLLNGIVEPITGKRIAAVMEDGSDIITAFIEQIPAEVGEEDYEIPGVTGNGVMTDPEQISHMKTVTVEEARVMSVDHVKTIHGFSGKDVKAFEKAVAKLDTLEAIKEFTNESVSKHALITD